MPALLLYSVGLVMKILIDLVKHYLQDKILNRGSVLKTITKLIIIYNDALFGVVLWVGGFNILYAQFPDMRWYQLLSVFIISSGALFSLNAFKCTAGTPIAIFTDSLETVFTPNSYFSDKSRSESYSVVFDTIFTYTIIHSLVISTWWGFWELENNYILLPCEIVIKDIQAWDSVIIAFLLSVIIFSINKTVKSYYTNNGPCLSIKLVINLISLAAFLASLNFWRGIWSLQDFYFFPSMNLSENLALSHVVGFLWSVIAGTGMMLTQSSTRDSKEPEYNYCQYWSISGACGHQGDQSSEQSASEPTETSPLVVRIL